MTIWQPGADFELHCASLGWWGLVLAFWTTSKLRFCCFYAKKTVFGSSNTKTNVNLLPKLANETYTVHVYNGYKGRTEN